MEGAVNNAEQFFVFFPKKKSEESKVIDQSEIPTQPVADQVKVNPSEAAQEIARFHLKRSQDSHLNEQIELVAPKKIEKEFPPEDKQSSDDLDDIEVPDEETSAYQFKYCFQSTTQKPEFTKNVILPSS